MYGLRDYPPRTRRGRLIIVCNLFQLKPHGSHHYFRGDEKVVCPGRRRDSQ